MTFDDYWQQCTEGIPPNGLYTADTVRELCRNAYLTGKDNDHLLIDAAMKVLRVHGNGQPKQLADAVLLIDVALKCRGTVPACAASRAEGANLTAGLCGDEARELVALRIWKADALERIAEHDGAYAEQGEMLLKMHGILNRVADMLFDARKELASVIELKDEYAETVKRTKKKKGKPHNAKVTGSPASSASPSGLPG